MTKEDFASEEIDAFFSQTTFEEHATTTQELDSLPDAERSEYESSLRFGKDVFGNGQMLWVKGNCHFSGSISNVVIVALGNVHVESDCRDSTIYTLGRITIRRALNCSLTAYREIHILAESEKSLIITAGKLEAAKAAFRGGRVEAYGDIEVFKASSLGGTNRLTLVSGDKKLIVRKVQLMESQQAHLVEKLNNVKKSVQNFVKVLIAKNLLGRTIPEFENLKKRQAHLEKLVQVSGVAAENMRKLLDKGHKSYVQVNESISKEVLVEVDGWHYETNAEIMAVRFTHDGSRVIREKIERDSPI